MSSDVPGLDHTHGTRSQRRKLDQPPPLVAVGLHRYKEVAVDQVTGEIMSTIHTPPGGGVPGQPGRQQGQTDPHQTGLPANNPHQQHEHEVTPQKVQTAEDSSSTPAQMRTHPPGYNHDDQPVGGAKRTLHYPNVQTDAEGNLLNVPSEPILAGMAASAPNFHPPSAPAAEATAGVADASAHTSKPPPSYSTVAADPDNLAGDHVHNSTFKDDDENASQSSLRWQDAYNPNNHTLGTAVFDDTNVTRSGRDPHTDDPAVHRMVRSPSPSIHRFWTNLKEDDAKALNLAIKDENHLREEMKCRYAVVVDAANEANTSQTEEDIEHSTLHFYKFPLGGKLSISIIALPVIPNVTYNTTEDFSDYIMQYYRTYSPALTNQLGLNELLLARTRAMDKLKEYGQLLAFEMAKPKTQIRIALVYYYYTMVNQLSMRETAMTINIMDRIEPTDADLARDHQNRINVYTPLINCYHKSVKYLITCNLRVPMPGRELKPDYELPTVVPFHKIPTKNSKVKGLSTEGSDVVADAHMLYFHRELQRNKPLAYLKRILKKSFTPKEAAELLKKDTNADRWNHRENKDKNKLIGHVTQSAFDIYKDTLPLHQDPETKKFFDQWRTDVIDNNFVRLIGNRPDMREIIARSYLRHKTVGLRGIAMDSAIKFMSLVYMFHRAHNFTKFQEERSNIDDALDIFHKQDTGGHWNQETTDILIEAATGKKPEPKSDNIDPPLITFENTDPRTQVGLSAFVNKAAAVPPPSSVQQLVSMVSTTAPSATTVQSAIVHPAAQPVQYSTMALASTKSPTPTITDQLQAAAAFANQSQPSHRPVVSQPLGMPTSGTVAPAPLVFNPSQPPVGTGGAVIQTSTQYFGAAPSNTQSGHPPQQPPIPPAPTSHGNYNYQGLPPAGQPTVTAGGMPPPPPPPPPPRGSHMDGPGAVFLMEPENPETDLTLSMYQLPESPAAYTPLTEDQIAQIRKQLTDELRIPPLLPHQKRLYGGHVLQKYNPSLNITPPPAGASQEEHLTFYVRLMAAYNGKTDASSSIPVFNGNFAEFIPFWEHFIIAVDNDPKLTILQKFDILLSKLGKGPREKLAYLQKTEQNYHVALTVILNEYGVIVEIVRVLLEKFYNSKRYEDDANYTKIERFFFNITHLVQTLAKFAPEFLQGRHILTVVERKISEKHFIKWRRLLGELWKKCQFNYKLYEEFQFRFLLKMLREEIRLLKECRLYNYDNMLNKPQTLPMGLPTGKSSNNNKSFSSHQISANPNAHKDGRGRSQTKASNTRSKSVGKFSKSPSSANHSQSNRTLLSPSRPPPRPPARSNSFGRSASRSPGRKMNNRIGKCLFCGQVHDLSNCTNTTAQQRSQLIDKQNRCRRCFKQHRTSACTSQKKCDHCGSDRHHTALHDPSLQKALKFNKKKNK